MSGLLTACFLGGILISSFAWAEVVLFSDNFNVSSGGAGSTNDVNYQYNANGRQGGLLAPMQYTQTPAGADSHHQVFPASLGALGQPLLLSSDGQSGTVSISPAVDFAQLPGGASNMAFSFDIDPNDPSVSASTDYSGVAFTFGSEIAIDRMGLVVHGSGRFGIFNGFTDATPITPPPPLATSGGGRYTRITITVSDPDGNPFDQRGKATMVFSSSTAGVFETFTRADFSGDYISFQGVSGDALSTSYIDNLSVSAIPEPSIAFIAFVCAIPLLLGRPRRPHCGYPPGDCSFR